MPIKDKPQSTTTYISECPYCGNDEIYIKQSIKGACEYNIKLNGEQANDNSTMHDGLTYTTIGKYAYCNNCGKRLFKLSDGNGGIKYDN